MAEWICAECDYYYECDGNCKGYDVSGFIDEIKTQTKSWR